MVGLPHLVVLFRAPDYSGGIGYPSDLDYLIALNYPSGWVIRAGWRGLPDCVILAGWVVLMNRGGRRPYA